MNCDWVQGNVTLYVYDELADDSRYELEQHIERCKDCAAEVTAAREFKMAMSALPQPEPSPNLLVASRMRLQEALEDAEPARGWRRFVIDPGVWLRKMKFSPALAAALLIVGFFGGVGTTYRIAMNRGGAPEIAGNPAPVAQPTATEASIVGIRDIVHEPGSDRVRIKYDTVVPQYVQAPLGDPRVQQLLLFAARNNTNSGLRMDSVDLLTQKHEDERVRELLMYALRNDSNPGVRLKALEGLGEYVKDDVRVRDAVLTALMSDENPGVRTLAIQMVRPVRADSTVRQVLQHLSANDDNSSIRMQARSALASAPQLD